MSLTHDRLDEDWLKVQQNRALCAIIRPVAEFSRRSSPVVQPVLPYFDGRENLAPGRLLEGCRKVLGSAVAEYALASQSTSELLKKLEDVLPSGYPSLLAKGSTRHVYQLPFGLVLKIEREDPMIDPLTPRDLDFRGGQKYLPHLTIRRRLANVSEMSYSALHPFHMPEIYGAMMGFGAFRPNPSVLVVKKLRPLFTDVPDFANGIDYKDIGTDVDGYLHIYDNRFSTVPKPKRGIRWYSRLPYKGLDSGVFLGNIGIDENGNYRFLDRGNGPVPPYSEVTFTPWNQNNHLVLPGSQQHSDLTEEGTKFLYLQYRNALQKAKEAEQNRR